LNDFITAIVQHGAGLSSQAAFNAPRSSRPGSLALDPAGDRPDWEEELREATVAAMPAPDPDSEPGVEVDSALLARASMTAPDLKHPAESPESEPTTRLVARSFSWSSAAPTPANRPARSALPVLWDTPATNPDAMLPRASSWSPAEPHEPEPEVSRRALGQSPPHGEMVAVAAQPRSLRPSVVSSIAPPPVPEVVGPSPLPRMEYPADLLDRAGLVGLTTLVPHPRQVLSPADAADGTPPETRAEAVRSRIEVHIGRVEVRLYRPASPEVSRSPRGAGFEDYALARNYLDRVWR
jgi:hypothetical protein